MSNNLETKTNKYEDCKIFVGNVPYQCTQEEFEKCFTDVEGYVKAEIITLYKSNTSRGFGFVTLNSLENAEKLKLRNDITFKGRILRFTTYQSESHNKPTIENVNNYLYVENIPSNQTINKKWLMNIFKDYGPIGKCYIIMNKDTGEYENCGVVEITDDDKYKNLLSKKKLIILNKNNPNDSESVILNISKYKHKIQIPYYGYLGSNSEYKSNKSNNSNSYYKYGSISQINNNSHNDSTTINRGLIDKYRSLIIHHHK